MKHLDLTQATDTLASYIQKLGDEQSKNSLRSKGGSSLEQIKQRLGLT